jgi:serine/threonine protein kinase
MHAGQHITTTIKLLRPLEQGGMGHIWVAKHATLNTEVAVKFMAPGYAEDAKLSQRFTQEAQLAARLQSPHVAQVFDHGVTPDREPYIVMELLSGETLRRRMNRSGPMAVEEVLLLAQQTAMALDAAHKLGIVHRDIKPENLFIIDVGGRPFIKVLDFGIAKQLRADPRLTTTTMTLGSPLYMSPEQFGDTRSVDHRADLWSLGVVTYEALTGRAPFKGTTVWALAAAVQKGVFRPPSAVRPELPRPLDDWMKRALACNVEARFGAALEMAEALSAACKRTSSEPLGLPDAIGYAATERIPQEALDTRLARQPDPVQKRSKQELVQNDKPSIREEPPADEPRLEIAHRPERGLLTLSYYGGVLGDITFDQRGGLLFLASLSGRVLCVDLAAKQVRWRRQLLTRGLRLAAGGGVLALGCANGDIHLFDATLGDIGKTLKGHERSVRGLAINRGGSLLAACGGDKVMRLWRVPTGERLHTINDNHFIGVQNLVFGGNEGLLASGGRDGTLRVWDSSLQPRGILQKGDSPVRAMAFSSDESLLAAGCDDGEVRLWKVRTEECATTIVGDKTPIISLAFDGLSGLLIAVLSNGNVRAWNVISGQEQLGLEGKGGPIHAAVVSPDRRYIASLCRESGTVHVYSWPPASGSQKT